MRTSKLPYLFGIVIAILCLSVVPLESQAAPKGKNKVAHQEEKERLVLMPLRLGEEDQKLQGAIETALVEGLQQKYEVFSGDQVAKKAREIFNKESHNIAHKECDETRCLQGIAEAFQAELLAIASVTKDSGGYFIALSIRNLYDNKDVYSKSLPCKGCDTYAVVEKLKELVGTTAPAIDLPQFKINPNDPESALWGEVQKRNTADDYAAYLAQYPKGKFMALAKARIKKLQDQAASDAAMREQQAWDNAQKGNSENSYALYLTDYPNGRYVALAKDRFDKLKNDFVGKEEADLWKKAESSNNQESVEAYIRLYPAGQHLAVASAKLAQLKESAIKEQSLFIENISKNMVHIPKKDYEINKFEVTQGEWKAIMGNNPSHFDKCGDNCPVEQVSLDDIQKFLQKLNAKTGKEFRLPTRDEWHFSCYGGDGDWFLDPTLCGSKDKGLLFKGHENFIGIAWYDYDSIGQTHPVGQKQANGYGLYDMSGNVWEWVSDCGGFGCRTDHPLGDHVRGGSWNSNALVLMRAIAAGLIEESLVDSVGFRLARSLP